MKVITSPVKRFSGTVTLSDPLTFPQVIALQAAFDATQALEKPTPASVNYALLPGVLGCVEAWGLSGFPQVVTAETFPATPPVSSGRLIAWLVEEVSKLYQEADDPAPLAV